MSMGDPHVEEPIEVHSCRRMAASASMEVGCHLRYHAACRTSNGRCRVTILTGLAKRTQRRNSTNTA